MLYGERREVDVALGLPRSGLLRIASFVLLLIHDARALKAAVSWMVRIEFGVSCCRC